MLGFKLFILRNLYCTQFSNNGNLNALHIQIGSLIFSMNIMSQDRHFIILDCLRAHHNTDHVLLEGRNFLSLTPSKLFAISSSILQTLDVISSDSLPVLQVEPHFKASAAATMTAITLSGSTFHGDWHRC